MCRALPTRQLNLNMKGKQDISDGKTGGKQNNPMNHLI